MNYAEEFFHWNTENTKNKDSQGGSHPYPGLLGPNEKITLDYCYYTPTKSSMLIKDENVK